LVQGVVADCHGRNSARPLDRCGCLTGDYRQWWRQAFWFSPLWCRRPSRTASSKAPKSQKYTGIDSAGNRAERCAQPALLHHAVVHGERHSERSCDQRSVSAGTGSYSLPRAVAAPIRPHRGSPWGRPNRHFAACGHPYNMAAPAACQARENDPKPRRVGRPFRAPLWRQKAASSGRPRYGQGAQAPADGLYPCAPLHQSSRRPHIRCERN